jgi:predicted DNA-binding transcriptional regulator AlpA
VPLTVNSPSLRDLLNEPDRIGTVAVEAVPLLIAEVEVIRSRLWARLISSVLPPATSERSEDRLLSIQEVSERTGLSVRWLYRNHHRLDFARPLSRRALRFSASGLADWLAQRHGRRGSRLSKIDD